MFGNNQRHKLSRIIKQNEIIPGGTEQQVENIPTHVSQQGVPVTEPRELLAYD